MKIDFLLYIIISPFVLLLPTLIEIIAICLFRLKNQSYFRYVLAQSVMAIFSYFLYNMMWRWNEFLIEESELTRKMIHATALFSGVAHEFVVAFIALDRLFVVVSRFKHRKYWRPLLYISIPLSFALAYAVTWQTFFNNIEFEKLVILIYSSHMTFSHRNYDEDGNYVIISQMKHKVYEIDLALNLTASLVASSAFSCLCYIVIYVYWKKKWSTQSVSPQPSPPYKTGHSSDNYESNFVWLAFFSFVSTLPLTIHQFTFVFADYAGIKLSTETLMFMFELNPWFMDVKYFASPYIIIAMNKEFREQCLQTVKSGVKCLTDHIPFHLSNSESSGDVSSPDIVQK